MELDREVCAYRTFRCVFYCGILNKLYKYPINMTGLSFYYFVAFFSLFVACFVAGFVDFFRLFCVSVFYRSARGPNYLEEILFRFGF